MIAETATGTRVLAWEQKATGPSDADSINVRVAAPGADFGATQTIIDASAGQPALAVGADGTVALVWSDFPASVATIRIMRLAPGASTFVGAPGIPAGGSVTSQLQPVVAGGDIFVAYPLFGSQGPTTSTAIDAVRLPVGATTIQHLAGATTPDIDRATFTSPAPPVEEANPTIATQGSTVDVGWELDQNGASGAQSSTTELRVAKYTLGSPPGATFTAPTQEATVTTPGQSPVSIVPQLAAGDGHVNAVWRQGDSGPIDYRDLTAGPTAPIGTVMTGGVDSFQASLAGDGTMIVAWQRFESPRDVNAVFASAVPLGQAPSAPQRITPLNASRTLSALQTAADGRALIVTDRLDEDGSNASDEQVQATLRSPGGAFGGLEEVSGP